MEKVLQLDKFQRKDFFIVVHLIVCFDYSFVFLLTYSVLRFVRLLKISWGRSSTSLSDKSLKFSRKNALTFQKKIIPAEM